MSPPIDDPVYGYRTINVAFQERNPESLLAVIRRLIRVRQGHACFGRGSIEFLDCGNPHVVAFVRRDADETILVTANLSGSPQPVLIDLIGSEGCGLVEIVDDVAFPPVGSRPYTVTLGPHACHWLQVLPVGASSAVGRHAGV